MHALGGLVGVGESQHILEPAAGKIAAGRQARGKEEDCEPALAHKFACCMDGMLPPQACPAAAALLTPLLHVPPPHPTPPHCSACTSTLMAPTTPPSRSP